ncbi:MAG TPA: hypothetical protein VK809_13540 [Bacteroidia bacterium]|nr:hypothetical protein [Bacteroidia bacterium]
MNFFNKNIPRRQLTAVSTRELHETLKRALDEILKQSCPCHYPRFRYLIQFQHGKFNAGPVFCADTNYLVSIARSKELDYLTLTSHVTENITGDYGEDLIYTCQKCKTVYKNICKQYSINFEFEYLDIIEPKYLFEIGADLTFPFPLLQGLYGFKDEDILKCSKEFALGSANEVYNYLTEIRQQ